MKQLTAGLKVVCYFGIVLQVPKSVTHIYTQSDGKLCYMDLVMVKLQNYELG